MRLCEVEAKHGKDSQATFLRRSIIDDYYEWRQGWGGKNYHSVYHPTHRVWEKKS